MCLCVCVCVTFQLNEAGFEAWERMGTLGLFLEDIFYSVSPNFGKGSYLSGRFN